MQKLICFLKHVEVRSDIRAHTHSPARTYYMQKKIYLVLVISLLLRVLFGTPNIERDSEYVGLTTWCMKVIKLSREIGSVNTQSVPSNSSTPVL